MKREIKKMKTGFTLIELLTAIAVIGILLAFLVPAFTKVQEAAHTARQKAQFHGIGIALEAFYTDYGDYPPSVWDQSTYGASTASHRLAEAVVGKDGLGVHRDTIWKLDGQDSSGNELYLPNGTYEAGDRFGPYMETEAANAVALMNLGYDSTDVGYATQINYMVLADMYKVVRNTASGQMCGMPILYYRANRTQTGNDPDATDTSTNTYDINDALGSGNGVASFSVPFNSSVSEHPMKTDSDYSWFYNRIQNPNFTNPERPYRSDSFILHSAGPDGLYGNSDDVFNFDQDH